MQAKNPTEIAEQNRKNQELAEQAKEKKTMEEEKKLVVTDKMPGEKVEDEKERELLKYYEKHVKDIKRTFIDSHGSYEIKNYRVATKDYTNNEQDQTIRYNLVHYLASEGQSYIFVKIDIAPSPMVPMKIEDEVPIMDKNGVPVGDMKSAMVMLTSEEGQQVVHKCVEVVYLLNVLTIQKQMEDMKKQQMMAQIQNATAAENMRKVNNKAGNPNGSGKIVI